MNLLFYYCAALIVRHSNFEKNPHFKKYTSPMPNLEVRKKYRAFSSDVTVVACWYT